MECSHPNRIRDKTGVLRCLSCGAKPEPARSPEAKPAPKRPAKKTKAD